MGWKVPDLTGACLFLRMGQMFIGCLMLSHPLAVKLGDGLGGQYPCWCFCLCSDFLLYLTLLLFPAFNFLHLGPHNLCQYSLFLVFYNGFIALSGRMKFSCPSSLRSSGFWSPGKHLVNDSESDYDSFGSNLLFSVNW